MTDVAEVDEDEEFPAFVKLPPRPLERFYPDVDDDEVAAVRRVFAEPVSPLFYGAPIYQDPLTELGAHKTDRMLCRRCAVSWSTSTSECWCCGGPGKVGQEHQLGQ